MASLSSSSEAPASSFSDSRIVPTFLLISPFIAPSDDSPSAEPRSFERVSPILINHELKRLNVECESVKKLRSGDLLVKVDTQSSADRLLSAKVVAGVPVKVVPHRKLNTAVGVIRDIDLVHMSDQEILDETDSQGVEAVRHIMVKSSPSPTVFLTFSST